MTVLSLCLSVCDGDVCAISVYCVCVCVCVLAGGRRCTTFITSPHCRCCTNSCSAVWTRSHWVTATWQCHVTLMTSWLVTLPVKRPPCPVSRNYHAVTMVTTLHSRSSSVCRLTNEEIYCNYKTNISCTGSRINYDVELEWFLLLKFMCKYCIFAMDWTSRISYVHIGQYYYYCY